MGKMKKLLSIILLTLLLIACKKEAKPTKSNISNRNKIIIKSDTLKRIKTINDKEVEKQTIVVFLKRLQLAVKSNNIEIINKSIKFPLEFSSGGESIFYNNYQEIKEDGSNEEFSKILEAKFIEKNNSFYKVRYQDPQSIDYFITFYFIKSIDGFKLKSFSEPY